MPLQVGEPEMGHGLSWGRKGLEGGQVPAWKGSLQVPREPLGMAPPGRDTSASCPLGLNWTCSSSSCPGAEAHSL